MASCLVDSRVILQLWAMWMQIMQGILMIGGLPQGYVSTLGGEPICSMFMVQSLVALSIIKSEYMAVAEAAKVALWLVGLVKELGIYQGGVQLHW